MRLLTLATSQERMGWGQNVFGSVAPWRCDCCGPVFTKPPEIWAEYPTWYEPGVMLLQCPYCDGWEIEENDSGVQPCRVIRRYSIHRNPNYRGAA